MSFEWIEQQMLEPLDARIALKEKLNEARARRRGLDLHIEKMMFEIRDAEIKRNAVCEEEDRIEDLLDGK